MELTDTHIHLYADELKTDLNELINTAVEKGVVRFFLPNIDSTSIDSMLDLEKNFPDKCFPMMGLHPCSVKENWKDELLLVENWLSKRKFAAVGEMGIDLYWDKTFIEVRKLFSKSRLSWQTIISCPL